MPESQVHPQREIKGTAGGGGSLGKKLVTLIRFPLGDSRNRPDRSLEFICLFYPKVQLKVAIISVFKWTMNHITTCQYAGSLVMERPCELSPVCVVFCSYSTILICGFTLTAHNF